MSPEIKSKLYRPVAALIVAGAMTSSHVDAQVSEDYQSSSHEFVLNNEEGLNEFEVNVFHDPLPILKPIVGPAEPDEISNDEIAYAFHFEEVRQEKERNRLEEEARIAEEKRIEEEKRAVAARSRLAPSTASGGVQASSLGSKYYWDNDPTCMERPDRYDWKRYALAVGFPEHVVNSSEMEYLISIESGGGDICAVNDNSGATCWVQQYQGGPQFLDPTACMATGYYKWDDDNLIHGDGIGGFQRHWYNHW